ncbi:hypothetical protein HKBW3S47_00354 [Candidatus Hakubella thermalkaliphila]|uniref:Uncharacterized protein n=1 Tax=Candidatus Hakubella thermalkaliphila TaxID=2754717 RepID=A0A6V8Q2D3_9ACTN|nr:hypothetical protein HKBW3S47_00354 [Candidatus Hakubella thermalkaliphila]
MGPVHSHGDHAALISSELIGDWIAGSYQPAKKQDQGQEHHPGQNKSQKRDVIIEVVCYHLVLLVWLK